MIISHVEIVSILTFILYLSPFLYTWKKYKLIKFVNISFIIQVVIGIILTLLFLALNTWISIDNFIMNILLETTYTYIMIGLFYYTPSLILLNIVGMIYKKLK